MYFVTQPMTCPKCGHQGNYSVHCSPALLIDGDVVCPECFKAMIRANCGMMQPAAPTQEPQE